MKTFMKNILILLGSFSLLSAELSIDAQIQEVKNAPASERVELMNALKTRLSTMNAQERNDAISELRSQSRTQFRTRWGEVQSDNMRQMQGMERMNQKQAGDNFMQHEAGSGITDKMFKHGR